MSYILSIRRGASSIAVSYDNKANLCTINAESPYKYGSRFTLSPDDHEYGTFGVYHGTDTPRYIKWRTHNGDPFCKQYVISTNGACCTVFSASGRPLYDVNFLHNAVAHFEEDTDKDAEEAYSILDRIYTFIPVEIRSTMDIEALDKCMYDILARFIDEEENPKEPEPEPEPEALSEVCPNYIFLQTTKDIGVGV